MKDKKIYTIILIIFTIIIIIHFVILYIYLRSLSTTPEYYSDEEIEEYVKDVFGDECKFVCKEDEHEYIYEDARGIQFSVRAISDEVNDVSWMGKQYFRKAVFDNYWESVVEYYETEIEAIAKRNNMEAMYYQYDIVLRIDSQKRIEEAAAVMEEIDHLLAMNIDYANGKLERYEITVVDYRLKICLAVSNSRDDSWVFQNQNRICELVVSTDENNRLIKEEIVKLVK